MIQVEWRGLTFGGPTMLLNTLTGWLELPGANFDSGQAVARHGSSDGPAVQGPRVVLAGGLLAGYGGTRDALVAELRRAMIPRATTDPTLEDLIVTAAGRTDTARAQLVRYALTLDPKTWASGSIPWSAQWRCPDPRIFGATVTATAPLVTATTGALLPQMLPFLLPDQPIGGQVSITNPGTDPEGSPTVVTLVGGQSGTVGVSNVSTGVTLTYGLTLGVSDTLVIDSEGGARLNGEFRPTLGPDVTSALRAQPGVNVFRALGSPGAGAPSISVAVRPASW